MDQKKEGLNRREFLKSGIFGGAAAAAGLSGWSGVARGASLNAAGNPAPVYRTLGRTGLKITVVSFGAMLTPEPEVIRAGLDQGINYIDTARRYMNGKNEEIVAQAIKGLRDKIFLATKTLASSNTKADIVRDVEKSLSVLQTDRIDVIQLHNLTSR
jgi:uncharacterized protein